MPNEKPSPPTNVLYSDGNGGLHLTKAGMWIGTVLMTILLGLGAWQLSQTAAVVTGIATLNSRFPPETQQLIEDRLDSIEQAVAAHRVSDDVASALLIEARETCAEAKEWAAVAETHWSALKLVEEKKR